MTWFAAVVMAQILAATAIPASLAATTSTRTGYANPTRSVSLGPAVPTVASLRTVYQFSNKSAFVENVAVRPDDTLLVTRVDAPELWAVDPISGNASLAKTIPNATTLTGIVDYSRNTYAVAAGRVNGTRNGGLGSWTIWAVDFINRPSITPLVTVKEALLLNGLTSLNSSGGILLATDSFLGLVYSIDTRRKTYKIAHSGPTLQGNASVPTSGGINGVKVFGGWMYYANSFLNAIYRVRISAKDGVANGPVQVIASNVTFPDDFAIDSRGNVYVASATKNEVVFIPARGNSSTILAGQPLQPTLAGATSVAFGKGLLDRSTLYVTTSGGKYLPINATYTEAGKIVALKLVY